MIEISLLYFVVGWGGSVEGLSSGGLPGFDVGGSPVFGRAW